jgi:murein DD-endopeptidase MepM/ murein hydrolase activator NlpD
MMGPSHRLGFALFAFLLASSMAACARPRPKATPTPLIAGLQPDATHDLGVSPTPTLEPFRIDLPLQVAAPISGWRPPLVPVPWAVSPYDHFYFARPIAADQVNWPLPNYRYGGVFFQNVVHTGVDIDAPTGTPILAAGPGTVVWSDWGLFRETPGDRTDPYGLAVVVRMDFGYKNRQLYSVYAHMSKLIAIPGQHVDTGDVLGLVGSTGATTGPHVHFEIRWGVNSFHHTYNPELWMAPPEGWGVLVGRVADTKDNTLQQVEITVQDTQSGQTRTVNTYGPGPVNADPYYNENMVLGDLPASLYKMSFVYSGHAQQEWVYIYAGQVTYFTFRGDEGFTVGAPPLPVPDSPATPAP